MAEHKCIALANDALKKADTELDLVFTMSGATYIQVATRKVDGAPKRAKAKALLATYCPLCGERWGE